MRKRLKKLLRSETGRLICRILLTAVILLILFSKVFLITRVSGMDMFPAVKDADIVVAMRIGKKQNAGSVVIYENEGIRKVGRIAAEGGDRITIDVNGKVYINGSLETTQIFYPTYVDQPSDQNPEEMYSLIVPEDEVYVLADYRTQAIDSRHFGTVPVSDIKGEVFTVMRRKEF